MTGPNLARIIGDVALYLGFQLSALSLQPSALSYDPRHQEDRMTHRILLPKKIAGTCVLLVALLAWPRAAEIPLTTKPEEVGLSSERLQRINEMMQRHIAAGDFSGAVTLVARNGRIAHLEAQGLMDIESKKPMQKDAIFRIMSMTKPVVGVAIMMMMEEGKVRLTDPVSKFIPEFKEHEGRGGAGRLAPALRPPEQRPAAPRFYTVPAEREITIRDLLTHTSGLVSGADEHAARRAKSRARRTRRWPTTFPRSATMPLEFQPGTRWAYSAQAGFDTLGRIVEIVSGQAVRSVPEAAHLRSARHEGHLLLSDRRRSTAHGRPCTQRDAEAVCAEAANPNSMYSTVYFSGGGGLISTRGGLPAVRRRCCSTAAS